MNRRQRVRAINYGGLNTGPSIGAIVGDVTPGSANGVVEDAPAREILGPDTEAGQALMVAGIGLALLFIAVGPEGGLAGKAGRVLGTLALVASAMVVVGFTGRTYAGLNPDRPLAQGVMYTL